MTSDLHVLIMISYLDIAGLLDGSYDLHLLRSLERAKSGDDNIDLLDGLHQTLMIVNIPLQHVTSANQLKTEQKKTGER